MLLRGNPQLVCVFVKSNLRKTGMESILAIKSFAVFIKPEAMSKTVDRSGSFLLYEICPPLRYDWAEKWITVFDCVRTNDDYRVIRRAPPGLPCAYSDRRRVEAGKRWQVSILESVERAIAWITQAKDQAFQVDGSYTNGGGQVSESDWMITALLTAPNENLQRDLLEHWTGTGALPKDLLDWDV